jgi:hypothetical protein
VWLRLWLVALLGAQTGAGLRFFVEAVRRDLAGVGAYDDIVLWQLLVLGLAALAGGAVALSGVAVRSGVVAALAGVLLVAFVPVDYRAPGVLTEWGLGALLVSPMVAVAAVVVGSCWRARNET